MRLLTLGMFGVMTLSLGIASAATIQISDLVEGFATVGGVPNCGGGVTSDCITNKSNFSNEGLFFTFVSGVNADPAQAGTFYTRFLEEAGGVPEGGGTYSDWVIFTTTGNSPNIQVQVCSDPDTSSLSCTIPGGATALPQDGTVENGTFQLVGQYVFTNGAGEIDNFYLASDVPEPASMLLLAGGLAGLALAGRKRKAA